jgi:hypothetical protein
MEAERFAAELLWPLAGVNKRHSYQAQPPLTTPSALNVWPDSASEGRQSGGSRPGIGKAHATDLGSEVKGLASATYLDGPTVKTRLVAVSGGAVYQEQTLDGALTSSASGLNSSKVIMAAVRDQIVYLADHADDQADSAGTYAPKKYNPATGAISAWTASDGTIPYGCPIVVLWRDRLVLAGGTTDAHGLFFSRQSDPEDFDYTEDDTGAAVNAATSEAGQVADIVTACAPHGHACMFVGCPTSLWLVRSDPGAGGWIQNISRKVGIVDRFAWCNTTNSVMAFLSHDGLWLAPASCSAAQDPTSFSREKIPEELLGVDRSTTQVSLAYDVRHRGIYIFLTPLTAGTEPAQHWYFDWETKSFWPFQFGSTDHDPLVVHDRENYTNSSNYSGVILGCRDGYLRRFKWDNSEDDGIPFESHVLLGPLGDPTQQRETLITELSATLGEDSGDALIALQSGHSPEAAFDAVARPVGRLRAGRSGNKFPRRRAQSHYVRLSGAQDGSPWAWDSGRVRFSHVGRSRP